MALALSEIGGFGFSGFEDGAHLRSHRSILDERIEWFNGTLNQHDHAHAEPPGAGDRVLSRERRRAQI
jgi:hypothetical protein